MASLRRFGGNQSRTAGQRSHQNPCKFARLKQSSHTWGPWRPSSSVPETLQLKKIRERKHQRSSLSQAAAGRRTVAVAAAAAASVLGPRTPVSSLLRSLAPRLGGRPSHELHLRAGAEVSPRVELGGSRARPGPVRSKGRARFSPAAGGPYSITAPRAEEAAATARTTAPGWSASSILVPEAAAAAAPKAAVAAGPGRRRSLHIGRGGPDGAWLSTPAIVQPRWFPGGAEAGKSVPHPVGQGREEVRGPRRRLAEQQRREGGGEQAQAGRGAADGAPRSLVAHSEVTRRKRRPSLPGHLPRAAHTRTPPPPSTTAAAAAAAHGARPPGRGGDERSHSPGPPPPPPSAHSRPRRRPLPPRLAALTPTPRATLAR